MLNKKPKSQFTGAFKKGFKAVILFETACIGGAYWIWHRANSSRGRLGHFLRAYVI